MPIKDYFHGHGKKVMSDMKQRYGPEKGESRFYATANAKKQNPEDQGLAELSRPSRKKRHA